MTHQVNLKTDDLLPGFGPVQLPLFVGVFLLAVAIAAGWIAFAWFERQSLLATEQEWTLNAQENLADLNEFQAAFPAVNDEETLEIENQDLTTQLQRTRETYSGLSDQLENAVEGFNTSLKQLSNYDVNGIWLEHIALQDGNRYFTLRGFSQNPQLIPQYLEQLGSSSFSGITIESMSVAKEEDQSLWRFSLSNTAQTLRSDD